MRISLAHSPDSDDAFMFYGLAKGRVPSGDLEIVHVLKDIETLNREAQAGVHEVTAISFHAYPSVADKYAAHALRWQHRRRLRATPGGPGTPRPQGGGRRVGWRCRASSPRPTWR